MRRAACCLLAVLALAACRGGSDAASPEAVVREWSRALNANDNERAASLFAEDARVVQGESVLRLRTHRDAVEWNEGLPCAGYVQSLVVEGDAVEATFRLGERAGHACDGPGQIAAAVLTIRDGKIEVWHQLPPPEPDVRTA